MSDPPAHSNGGRLSYIERLLAAVGRITLRNAVSLALLIVAIIPAMFAWRFTTDETFRDDLLNTVQRRSDIEANCAIYRVTVEGEKRTHVSAFIGRHNGHEFYMTAHMRATAPAAVVQDICERMNRATDEMRRLIDVEDEGGASP